MKKQTLWLALLLAASISLSAQNPSSTDPLTTANTTTTNGVAPGYWPTAGGGLVLNLSAGTSFCAGSIATYAGGTLTLTASATNRVYLDTASSCVPAFNTSGFSSTNIPIAIVTTSGGAITGITDVRTMFIQPGGTGMIWPSGGAGIPNYSGSSSWGTSYSASNLIPFSFLNITAHNVVAPLVCLDTSGSGTTQVCNTTPTFTPASGDSIIYATTTPNSGALTISVNGASAAPAKKWQGTALASGDVPANKPVLATFDGTNWNFATIGNAPTSGGTPGGSNTQVQYNASGAFGGTAGATADPTNIYVTTQAAGDDSTKAASTQYLDRTLANDITVAAYQPTAGQWTVYPISRDTTFAANFSGSQGSCFTPPNATVTFQVYVATIGTPLASATLIGSVSLNTSCVPTFSTVGGAIKTANSGQYFALLAPIIQDPTLNGAMFVFKDSRIN